MPIGHTNAKPIETDEICFYGCGNKAKFQFDNGRVCCSEDFRQCSGYRERVNKYKRGKPTWNKGVPPNAEARTNIGLGNKGKKAVLYAQPVVTNALCEYGCGKRANYVFSNGKLCCSKDFKACPGFVNRLNDIKKKKYPKFFDHIGVDEWTYDRVKEIVDREDISIPIYIRHVVYEDLKRRLQSEES